MSKLKIHRIKQKAVLLLLVILYTAFFLLSYQTVSAQPLNVHDAAPVPPEALEVNLKRIAADQGLPSRLRDIGGILGSLTPWLFTFAGIALFIYLIMGGLSYLTSAGDPKKVESARGKITAALIGFIIVFVAFWIVQITAFIFGIQSLKVFFGLTISN